MLEKTYLSVGNPKVIGNKSGGPYGLKSTPNFSSQFYIHSEFSEERKSPNKYFFIFRLVRDA